MLDITEQLQAADERELRHLLAEFAGELLEANRDLRRRVGQLETVIRAIGGAASTVTSEADR